MSSEDILNSPRWQLDMMIEADPTAPVKIFYFSFAGDEGFRGGLLIRAKSWCGAVVKSHRLGVNPGGEIKGLEVEYDVARTIDSKWFERLLSRDELEAMEREGLH